MTDFRAGIDIRQSGPADADTLASVGAESFTATYEATTTPADIAAHVEAHFSAAAIRDAMANTSCHYYLATVERQPAGLLKLRMNDVPEAVPDRNAIEIQLLYVVPAFQRYGLGAQLVDVAIGKARDDGIKGVWLSAWEQADWAIGFYRKVGFRQVGTQAFRVGTTAFTDFIMYLAVD